ncbi:conserved membrane hypothetical protein [uncultured Paludibacter sp.]|uniref:Transmembrane protein n=1 Tax=uncultured Paludibacter sp. TaxID=497635 RepID=A0A653AGF0_9BACT|nr:conserved membrane hypothetical protein [uncultured Paludibacter sp.]
MKINLQKIIVPNPFVTIFTFVASVALWLFFYFAYSVSLSANGSVTHVAEKVISSSSLMAHLITLAVAVFISLLLAQINNRYAYINTRTFLPTFFFLLLSVFWIDTHGNYLAYLAALSVMFAIYLFFNNYANENGTEIAFLGFIFLSLSVLILPEYILLLPFVWIGFYQLKCLSFRTFFASLLGFLVPWLAVYGWIYFTTKALDYYPDFLGVFNRLSIISFTNLPTLIYGIVMSAIFLILTVGAGSNINRESIKTRRLLFFFRIIGFGLILLMIFFCVDFVSYLPLGAAFFAVLAAYTFTYQRTLFYSVLFIFLFLIVGLFTFYQILF